MQLMSGNEGSNPMLAQAAADRAAATAAAAERAAAERAANAERTAVRVWPLLLTTTVASSLRGSGSFYQIIRIHQLRSHSHMKLHHGPSTEGGGSFYQSTRANESDRTNTSTSLALSGALPRLIRPRGSLGCVVLVESARSLSVNGS